MCEEVEAAVVPEKHNKESSNNLEKYYTDDGILDRKV